MGVTGGFRVLDNLLSSFSFLYPLKEETLFGKKGFVVIKV